VFVEISFMRGGRNKREGDGMVVSIRQDMLSDDDVKRGLVENK
jgi:hypothetical protein